MSGNDPSLVARRAILRGLAGAAAAGLLGAAARASDGDGISSSFSQSKSAAAMQPDPPARRALQVETRTLAVPEFARLHSSGGFIAGVRPHRRGGARIERAAPVDMPDGPRHIIHNYGHGGAGITLSFGSAERASDLVRDTVERYYAGRPPAMAVIGAGVIGLTTARALKVRWPGTALAVYAAECDGARTTSYKAGGMFAPISTIAEFHGPLMRAELSRIVETSRRTIEGLASGGRGAALGVTRKTAYTLRDGAGSVRLRMGTATRLAESYGTWLLDPTVLLAALRRDLEQRGVAFHSRRFAEEGEVYQLPERLVVNCTGYGARRLFTDTRLEPRRGHLVRLENPAGLDYLINSWCGAGIRYLFARGGDIIIGGSIQTESEEDAFNPNDPTDARICERILRSAASLFAAGPIRCA